MGTPAAITATSLSETTVVEGIMGGVEDMAGMEGAMVGVDIMAGEAATTDSYFFGIVNIASSNYLSIRALTMPKEHNARDTKIFCVGVL